MITNVKEFIGWELIIKDEVSLMHQVKLTNKLIEKFKEEISKMKWKSIPMSNLIKITRPDYSEEEDILETHFQTWYQSVVGSLLYLVKYSRPYLSNSVSELSKLFSWSLKKNPSSWKVQLNINTCHYQ